MNEDRYEIFDKYLNNELNLEEKINFENQLVANKEMSESFEIFKDLNGYLDNKFQNETQLNAFKENLKTASLFSKIENKSKVFSIKPIYYAVAACFALVFGLMVFNNSSVPTYQDFNQHEQAQFTERGGDDLIKLFKQAQEAFNNDNFVLSAKLFQTILKTNSSPEIEFFYGVSLLETNKYFEAEMVFNNLKIGKSIYKTRAIWYLALSKLKQKDYDSCKKILKTIPKDFEDYNQVEKLLGGLE